MASPPVEHQSRSVASSTSDARASVSKSRDPDIPVEALVEHLLAAKRSLSSMQHILHANDLTTRARQSHEEAAVLGTHTAFLQRAIWRQTTLLVRVRRGLKRTYDAGKREFNGIVRKMDATNEDLQRTMDMLRGTAIEAAFRPEGGDSRNLMDFLDEQSVHGMVEALKKSLGELQAIQVSFDGDLLRFDDDLRALKKTTPPRPAVAATANDQSMSDLLFSLEDHSHTMAELLSSLTKHFDLCVTAVRTTEGGADLARQRAAEVGQGGDPVSISGVIADQESQVELEPTTTQDRTDMLDIVVSDASEVEGVVQEINERLQAAVSDFDALTERARQIKTSHAQATAALLALEDIGAHLAGYLSAEAEFLQRWEDEKYTIHGKLGEMEDLREFYERYAGAYDSLLLEVERRRAVEDRVKGIWRKAQDAVDKLVEGDRQERESFRQDVGEFIPTDLWPRMGNEMKRWELVPAGTGDDGADEHSTPALDKRVVDAARSRLERG